jgi:hypothetical protein
MPRRKRRRPRQTPAATTASPLGGRAPQTAEEEDALRYRIVRRILELRCKVPAKCDDQGCRRLGKCRKLAELDRQGK